MREVVIEGHRVTVSGEAGDPYFENAQIHVDGLSDLRRIAGQLRDGAVVFDIGANIGLSAMLLAILNPSLTIHAFEPSPTNFEHLVRNTRQIGNGRIHLHQQAASDQASALSFREIRPDHGGSGGWSHVVDPDCDHRDVGIITVQAVPLDDFMNLAPDFIKIDVEGHEPEVIAGAAQLLSQHRPLVHMEFNPWTLSAYGKHSPAAFAETLFRCFDVEGAIGGATELIYATIANGTMMDIAMRPKYPFLPPTLADLSFPPAAVKQIRMLSARG